MFDDDQTQPSAPQGPTQVESRAHCCCCDATYRHEHTTESATLRWLRHLREQGKTIRDV